MDNTLKPTVKYATIQITNLRNIENTVKGLGLVVFTNKKKNNIFVQE